LIRKAVSFQEHGMTIRTVSPPAPLALSHDADWRAAVLSSLIPGCGQALRGAVTEAGLIGLVTLFLVAMSGVVAHAAGIGAAIFFIMLVVLPWWVIQAYDAFLWGGRPVPLAGTAARLQRTWAIIWLRAHDIRYLGALFLLTAFTDFYIIVANPEYALTIFCQKPGGALGVLAKAQSPTLHTLIGYGFLRLRRWALFLYVAYAGFGLLNATVNYACFGYGRVRTVFLLSLLVFTGYVVWRRDRFQPSSTVNSAL
jgi:hypothetical protein